MNLNWIGIGGDGDNDDENAENKNDETKTTKRFSNSVANNSNPTVTTMHYFKTALINLFKYIEKSRKHF